MRYPSYRGYELSPVWVIIAVNLLVYLANIVATRLGYQLVPLLGLQGAGFWEKPWTIMTSFFTHVSLWHLLANMLTLYFFGSFLDRLIGTRNFLFVYFCGGILGSIFYLLLAPPFYTAIGASGAVFALGGVLTVLTPRMRVFVFPIPAPLPLWIAVIGGFLIMALFPQVAWQAHLGGLIFGLAAGWLWRSRASLFF